MYRIEDSLLYRNATQDCISWLQESFDLSALAKARILITGGTGQLGSALANLLLSLDESTELEMEIFVAGRTQTAFQRRFSARTQERLRFLHLDLAASGLPECPVSPDFIVHSAGYGDPRAFVEDPVGVMTTNIHGADLLLAMLAQRRHGRMLFISSGETYGTGAEGVDSFTEDYCGSMDAMRARSCYPMAKRATETLCASYAFQHEVDVLVARQCHAFGPSYTENDSRVTAQFLDNAAEHRPIVMKSAGLQVRSYLFELDAATAYVTLLLKGVTGEAYNVAPSYATSIRQLAESIATAAEVDLVIEAEEDPSTKGYGNIPRSVLDASKLRGLGWHELFTLDEALAVTVGALQAR